MQLTKHVHACVTVDREAGRLVIDPGALTPTAADLIADTETVLITHEHFDHFHDELLAAAIQDRPEFTVYGPASVVARWDGRPRQVVTVTEGDHLDTAGFHVTVHGSLHAPIHRHVPQVSNVGYLIDGAIYHPGDAYHVPLANVGTLLLPTSGVWTNFSEAVDFVRAVSPRQLVQIHELMLSDIGQVGWSQFLRPAALSPAPLTILSPGDSIDL
jgi:L-ascorbate metabolism protein UlaG (beta-lactamase superfamily)